MFGAEGDGGRGEKSRGEGFWNVPIFSIIQPFSPPLSSSNNVALWVGNIGLPE